MTEAASFLLGGKYELVRPISGGVWEARHATLGRSIVVKTIASSDEALATGEATIARRRRFEREAHVLAELSNQTPHVARVLDFGSQPPLDYIVMERLRGETLAARIANEGRLDPAEVGVLVTQTANALSAMHKLGILHRDLRPGNVFLAREADALCVKVLDFGLARARRSDAKRTKLTLQGMALGEPAYASPEQAMGEKLDARADVWSLAVVAFEALAGVSPFAAATAHETLRRVCTFDATPLRSVVPGASEGLESVFWRAFAREATQRFQSAAGFAGAFAAALPPRSRTPSLAFAAQADDGRNALTAIVRVRPRRWAPVAGAGFVAAIVVIAAVVAFTRRSSTTTSTSTATEAIASVAPEQPPSSAAPTTSVAPVALPALPPSSARPVPHRRVHPRRVPRDPSTVF